MTTIQLIIFDLDGTLIDSLDDLAAATNHMLTSLGRKPVGLDQVRGYVGQGARRLVERAMPAATGEEIEIGINLFVTYNEAHIVDRTRLYLGAMETLSALRDRGMTMAVVSNKNVALCRKVLSTLDADGFFATVIGADSVALRKPSPEPLLMVLRQLGVTADRALMVGDSINDIAAGNAAGIATVGCTFGYGDLAELENATWRIDSVPELLQLPVLRDRA
ncbi:MAG: HAD-IIIA family hydrolase [Geobacteraceae bacterium]|nr:HAD-IIIA family hydrolase [Geobacteraceae bacterium]